MAAPLWRSLSEFIDMSRGICQSRPDCIIGHCARLLEVVLKRQRGWIMAEKRADKCAHPGCNCPTPKGRKYCSPYCEAVGDRLFMACECGHTGCAGGESTGATE